jgi:hypothetical protein
MPVRNSTKTTREATGDYLISAVGLTRSGNYLPRLAAVGDGSAFCRAGHHPLYLVEGFDGWATGLIGGRVRSTSEPLQNAA